MVESVGSPGNGPLVFDIGDSTDITSEVVPFINANSVFKFAKDDARAAALSW